MISSVKVKFLPFDPKISYYVIFKPIFKNLYKILQICECYFSNYLFLLLSIAMILLLPPIQIYYTILFKFLYILLNL